MKKLYLSNLVLLALGIVIGFLFFSYSSKKTSSQLLPLLPLPPTSLKEKISDPVNPSTELSAFPNAKPGMKRFVINLPPIENEHDTQIELIVGKNMMVDCNSYSLNGDLEYKTIEGWGYHYLEVIGATGATSTLMGCPDQSDHEKFVTLWGEPHLYKYTSKLPVVVYVPEDLKVFYRIWNTTDPKVEAQIQ